MIDIKTYSVLYVSRRLATSAEVDDIIEMSRARNTTLQITGALFACLDRSAQILEGPKAGVDTLMTSIHRDRRHADVAVLLNEDIEMRRFPGWSMAYSGESAFVDGLIKALVKRTTPEPDTHQVRRLISVMTDCGEVFG